MLKFDDQFPLHRKVAGLSDGAFRLHVEAIFWSRRNLTDGFVPSADLSTVSARIARPDRLAPECVQRGAWHRVTDGRLAVECAECAERHAPFVGDGWLIHGYADWQDTAAKVKAKSEAKVKAGRLGGIKSGQSRSTRRSKREAGASPVLAKQTNPEPPRPPTGGSGGRGRAQAPPGLPAPHPFDDDGTGIGCKACPLPRINKIHPQ